jgi:uncharacterized glyoxalase superfamily protein PhnB
MAQQAAISAPTCARLNSVAPGMPTTDMARTLGHYGRMGFAAVTYEDGGFAILRRDGVELQFSLRTDHDPRRTAACIYVRVDDVDGLYREYAAAGITLRREPHDTDHRMREFAHIDPDNNMIIFGAPM